MKSKSTLKRIYDSHKIASILGEKAFEIYSNSDFPIYIDPKDGTYSVRELWEADDLTAEDLNRGIINLFGGDDEQD